MNDLLYLAHRIPYPPDKGDKIRSWHLLKRLARRWNVHLGAFIDDPDDWQHVPVLEELCAETRFVGLNPATAKLRALRGLITGTSLTTPYYRSRDLRRWVSDLAARRRIDYVVVFSSSMAQYALPLTGQGLRRVIDFCDMDSDKWRQYSEKLGGIRRWVYAREARKLLEEESAVARAFDASVLISDDEVSIFCDQTEAPQNKVHMVPNGVDTDFFDPGLALSDPYDEAERAVVFVGAMDYWPNIDAVTWFAEDVFPAVRQQHPEASFYIVGSNPGADVRELGQRDGITVTGRVDDVRPYLAYAHCAVAPLRVARGVQNKVLEAMAMARPVLASTAAMEGIAYHDGLGVSICNDASHWVDELGRTLAADEPGTGAPDARRHVAERYSWDASAHALSEIVTGR